MARVNVYLPDELAAEARLAGLNVSALAQEAIGRELRARRMRAWLDDLRAWHATQPQPTVSRDEVRRLMDEVREELWGE